MIRPLSIVSVVLFCSLSAFAQSGEGFPAKGNSTRAAGKKTGITERLVGSSHWNFSSGALVQADTVRYNYSGNNGWGGDLVGWKFDARLRMELDNFKLNNSSRYTSSFDEHKRITAQIYENWNFTAKEWERNRRTVYSYTAEGKVESYESQVLDGKNWDPRYRVSNSYNAHGAIIETIDQQRKSSGAFVNHTKTVKTYNALELPEVDTFFTWKSGDWQVSGITAYSYSGKLLSGVLHYRRNENGVLEQKNSTVYTYDSEGRETESLSKSFDNGAWVVQSKNTRHYDASGNLKSSVLQHQIIGEFVNRRQTTCSYNSNGQLISEASKSWKATKNKFEFGTGDFVDNYSYEQYNGRQKEEVLAANTLQVQSNTANSTLKFTFKWREKQPATISMIDVKGRVVEQWSVPAATLYSQTLDVARIPSGIYTLQVVGSKDKLSKQVSIEK